MPVNNIIPEPDNKSPTELAAYYFEKGSSPEEVEAIMLKRKIRFPTISQVMNDFMGKKNISVERISDLSDINPSTIYRIMNSERNPTRNAIIRIAMAMPLNFHETQVLLKSADCSLLSASRERDLIIMEGIAQVRDYETVNETLRKRRAYYESIGDKEKANKMSDLSIKGESRKKSKAGDLE